MPGRSSKAQFLVGLGILVIAVSVFLILTFTRKSPDKKRRSVSTATVEVQIADVSSRRIIVNAMGNVKPARSVQIVGQVGGEVVYLSPNLIPGGYVKKGDVLIRIDPTDYDLAIREAQAAVSQAELTLQEQQGAKIAAQREMELAGDDLALTEEGLRLANREMYVKNAQAQLEAAKSRLAQAKLSRSRTIVKAPFDAQISEKSIDIGRLVTVQSPIATLVANDIAWIEATMPVESLRRFDIPGVNAETGASVTIRQKLADKVEITRQGTVLRLLPGLMDKGTMARVLIEVNDPFGKADNEAMDTEKKSDEANLPLLMGAFVRVEIAGHIIPNLIAVPRAAIRDNNNVWVRNDTGQLEFRKVETVWSDDEAFYVQGDLARGETMIVSRLTDPIPGMNVSLQSDKSKLQPSEEEKKKGKNPSGNVDGVHL